MKTRRMTRSGVATLAAIGLCGEWSAPERIGKLDTSYLDEQSGLAVSKKFSRLYHVNDSGDGPFFYVTALDGGKTQKIRYSGDKPKDAEDLALGPCPTPAMGEACLAIADIGDNSEKRKGIEIVFIKEDESFAKEVAPIARLQLKYPDQPHNAEAFDISPSGELVIVTKEGGRKRGSQPAQMFWLSKDKLASAIASGAVATLERTGEIDVPAILKDKGLGGLVTAMKIAGDGRRMVLLTYSRAVEVELETGPPRPGKSHKAIELTPLLQQESVAYDVNGKDVLYATEASSEAPLMRAKCKR